jgi:hypothetical protein
LQSIKNNGIKSEKLKFFIKKLIIKIHFKLNKIPLNFAFSFYLSRLACFRRLALEVAVLGLEAPWQLVLSANARLGVQAGDQVHWLWRHRFSTIFMHQKGGFIMPKIAKNLITIINQEKYI